MRKCPRCGAENPDDKKWCISCKKPLLDNLAAESSHDKTAEESRLSGSMGNKTYRKPDGQKTAGDKTQSHVSGFAHSDAPKNTDEPNEVKNTRLSGSIGDKKYEHKKATEGTEFEIESVTFEGEPRNRYCTKCGNPIEKDALFCTRCGKPALEDPTNLTHFDQPQKMYCTKLILGAIAGAFVLFLGVLLLCFSSALDPMDAGADEIANAISLADNSPVIDYNKETGSLYINNEIIVVAKANTGASELVELAETLNATVDHSLEDIGIYSFRFDKSMTYDEMIAQVSTVKHSRFVEDAYLNVVIDVEDDFEHESALYPTDPWAFASWNVEVPRDANWGVEAIDAPGAWGYLDDMATVRIGLIDTVPDTAHDEIILCKQTNYVVNTENGTTRTYNATISPDDHGTHVAAIMDATWNTIGLSGILGGKGELYYSSVYFETAGRIYSNYYTAYSYLLALKTLIDDDVQVINISQNTSRLKGFAASHGNVNAISYLTGQAKFAETGLSRIISNRQSAGKCDFVICVAAGNSNNTYYYKDDNAIYGYRENMNFFEQIKSLFGWKGEIGGSEAKYNNFLSLIDDEEVANRIIVVGAAQINEIASTDSNTVYGYAAFSNIGERVDVVAPGCDIYSAVVGGYKYLSGTSMASPHVAGVAGLIFACNPDLTGEEVKETILHTTTDTFAYTGGSSGMVNAKRAVICALGGEVESNQEVSTRETSDERDIVLVLDTSGSMSGTPITETKKAATNFINTILQEDASIGIVTYDSSAHIASDFSTNASLLTETVENIYADGNTNIDDGLSTAYSMLQSTGAKKKIIVLMSDGMPNEGRQGDSLIAYADELKNEGVLIYTLGFFEDLGSEKASAQALMEGIASNGCHYEVANADDLVFFFGDMADQINGQKYIYIRIACPVDVYVSFNGEVLNSSERNQNLRTDFGTISFEENEDGSSDPVKILRLKDSAGYDVKIFGTGYGYMDYTIGFMDENGEYTDLRTFRNIQITNQTAIDTIAAHSDETVLNVDSDGDGKYDVKYRAEAYGYGKEVRRSILPYVGIVGALVVILYFALAYLANKKKTV